MKPKTSDFGSKIGEAPEIWHTDGWKDELIRKQDALDAFKALETGSFEDRIRDLPSHVVRCRDCKYCTAVDFCGNTRYICEHVVNTWVDQNDFCCYGERKDE